MKTAPKFVPATGVKLFGFPYLQSTPAWVLLCWPFIAPVAQDRAEQPEPLPSRTLLRVVGVFGVTPWSLWTGIPCVVINVWDGQIQSLHRTGWHLLCSQVPGCGWQCQLNSRRVLVPKSVWLLSSLALGELLSCLMGEVAAACLGEVPCWHCAGAKESTFALWQPLCFFLLRH